MYSPENHRRSLRWCCLLSGGKKRKTMMNSLLLSRRPMMTMSRMFSAASTLRPPRRGFHQLSAPPLASSTDAGSTITYRVLQRKPILGSLHNMLFSTFARTSLSTPTSTTSPFTRISSSFLSSWMNHPNNTIGSTRMSSTLKKRRAKMNKHKLRKRKKKDRRKNKK